MFDKLVEFFQKICDLLELVLAAIIGIALVWTLIVCFPDLVHYLKAGAANHDFIAFLESIFSLVVGVEFLKMLCKPSTEHVIEVVIFLIARHMIIGSHSAVDNLLSVVGIGLLLLIGHHLKENKIVKENKKDVV